MKEITYLTDQMEHRTSHYYTNFKLIIMADIEKAQVFELDSLTDLIRLVVSRIDRSNRSGYIYFSTEGNKPTFISSQVVPGWYNLRGLPMTLKAEGEEPGEHNFIRYSFATEFESEKWEFTNHINTDPKVAHIPLIRIKEIPKFLI